MENNNQPPPGFESAEKKARAAFEEDSKVSEILEDAQKKARTHRERLQKFLSELELLLTMVRAYKSGTYRKIPWRAIVMALAGIIYFLNPFDIIPDFFAVFGYIDDAAIIGFIVESLREELNEFKAYLDTLPEQSL